MKSSSSRWLEGWRLTVLVGAAIGLGALWTIVRHPGDIDGIRLVIRGTARTSFILFALAFTASSLTRLWPNAWTLWQRRNRRFLGLSFAVSHSVHLMAVIALARRDPALFTTLTNPVTVISGGAAYLLIAAMAATSFDRAALLLGPRAWRMLHVVGSYYIWASFATAFGRRAVHDGYYVPFAVVVTLMLAVRVLGRFASLSRGGVALTGNAE